MKNSLSLTAALLFSAGHVIAQAPNTIPLPAPASDPSLAQRIKAAEPEIERLLAQYRNPEALKVLEALLPQTKPEFDGKTSRAAHDSFTKYTELAKAYYRAAQHAHLAGNWEKAVDYGLKAQAIAKENAVKSKELITPFVEGYKSLVKNYKVALELSADRIKEIKEIKAKRALDPSEQQEWDLIQGAEQGVVDGEKWGTFFQNEITWAQNSATAYDQVVEGERTAIKDMETAIEGYKAGKGDKAKYVEAVASYPQNLVKQYPDKKDRAAYLYRLAVLAPENKKVQKEIDALISGKPSASEKKTKG